MEPCFGAGCFYLFIFNRQTGGREEEKSFCPFFLFFLNGTQREQHAEAEVARRRQEDVGREREEGAEPQLEAGQSSSQALLILLLLT